MSSKSFRVNIFQVKEMMRLRDKYKKKGKLVNLLVKKQEFDKDLDKVLVNQMRNVIITETEIYKSKMNINKRNNENNRIARVRSHHLTNYLSDYLINAFQSGSVGLGLSTVTNKFQISRVELPADMRVLKIFWFTNKKEDDNLDIEKHLDKLANDIRYQLTSDRVLGYIPPVEFKRDESRLAIERLDEILLSLKTEVQHEPEPVNVNVSKTDATTSDETVDQVPIMNTVYGVDYDKLLAEMKTNSIVQEVSKPSQSDMQAEKTEAKMKAFQMNQMFKTEKRSRSALLKIALDELETLKIKGN